MVNIKSILLSISWILLIGLVSKAYAANIIAHTDRTSVYEGESITLTYDVHGSADGRPDFTAIEKDFDILGRNKSSSMQFINGKMSSKVQWILTLMPKRMGQLRIPPIYFGKDKSNDLMIQVRKEKTSSAGKTAEDMFLQVSVDPNQAYIQSQILYTIRIYVAVRLNNASLSEPELSVADAVIERLGEDKRFQTTHLGRHYQVIERSYAIFPQQSGKLRINPVVFSGQIVRGASNFMNPFNQFTGKTRRMQSKAIEIDVKPAPKSQQGTTWLPTSRIELSEHWPSDPPVFKVGEAVTRTLTLKADGLTAAQLPEISKATPDGFKTYPDQPQLEDLKHNKGITGQRTEKIAMIANKPGKLTLPAISINWWNTKTNKAEVVSLPARTIMVAAADNVSRPVTKAEPVIPDMAPSENTIHAKPEAVVIPNTQSNFWSWVSLGLVIAWLSSMFIMWRKLNRLKTTGMQQQNEKQNQQQASLKQLEKQIKQACDKNDAQACKAALLDWARVIHPEQQLNALSDIGSYFGSELDIAISKLSQTLYSQNEINWQGGELWQAWQQANQQSKNKLGKNKPELAPMYP
ncbi:MAG: BatD family protein [Gammaproteobacteria bacterium]|nr:BatD family protein [Gammaproteobacteria bacterium]